MRTTEHPPWPYRFGDPEHPPAEIEPELRAVLRSLSGACADAPVPSERATRQAARRAIASLDAPFSVARGIPRWLLARFRLGRFAMGLSALLVLQLAVALAWKLAPDGPWRLGQRFGLGHLSQAPAPKEVSPTPVPAAPARPSAGGLPASQLGSTGAVGPAVHSGPSVPPAVGGPLVWKARPPSRPGKTAAVLARSTPAAAPAPIEDRLAAEASLVARAIALASDDPRASLELLGNYWRRFPDGALRGEAAVAEIGAHLSLGENGDALKRLDGFARDGFRGMTGTVDELRVSRLELMTGAGRCPEALPLLEQELAGPTLAPPLRGRALLARAACKARMGDARGNRADLERYLSELPGGPRAAEVRRALGIGE